MEISARIGLSTKGQLFIRLLLTMAKPGLRGNDGVVAIGVLVFSCTLFCWQNFMAQSNGFTFSGN